MYAEIIAGADNSYFFVLICIEVFARWFGFSTRRNELSGNMQDGEWGDRPCEKDKLSLGEYCKRINTMRHRKFRQSQERNLI